MRKIREVLRLKWQNRCSNQQIAKSCSIARSTVREYLRRAQGAGLRWPLEPEIDDTALDNLLFPVTEAESPSHRQMPPTVYLFRELKRPGVTLQPQGYQYSQFCNLYRQWLRTLDLTLRQHHRAGEKLFVDFAGKTLPIVNPDSGEISQAHLFVAVLGASDYTYAEATQAEDLPSWIKAHIHAFEFFGGVAEILVPDNTKTAVTKPSRYEPDINPTYQDLAQHYRTTVIPTRPGRPRDRAKVPCKILKVSNRSSNFLKVEKI